MSDQGYERKAANADRHCTSGSRSQLPRGTRSHQPPGSQRAFGLQRQSRLGRSLTSDYLDPGARPMVVALAVRPEMARVRDLEPEQRRRARSFNARRLRRSGATGPRDRGAGTLELVVVFPVVLVLIIAIIQAALFFHARNVALAAAQEGVRAATSYGAAPSRAVRAAQDFLDGAGQGALQSRRITRSISGQSVTLTVAGQAPAVLPGIRWGVAQTASGPIERFTG